MTKKHGRKSWRESWRLFDQAIYIYLISCWIESSFRVELLSQASQLDSSAQIQLLNSTWYFFKKISTQLDTFWVEYSTWRDQSIHQTQYLSEAENYLLFRMLENWNRIQVNLYFKIKKYSIIECLKHIANVIWKNQMLNQSITLHVVSALLLSWNHDIKIVDLITSSAFNIIMMSFFIRYISSSHNVESTMKQWLAFRSQIDDFQSNAECWRWAEDSKLFWLCIKLFFSQLLKLFLWINRISDNNVLVKRDWSVMNLIKMKTRNQLSNINIDKLMYIYINERTLNRSRNLKKKLRYTQSIEIDEKKLLNMKDRLLQKKVAMTRLNSLNDEMLKDFLNSIVNDEITMKHSTNWCYLYIPLCLKHALINMFKTRFTLT